MSNKIIGVVLTVVVGVIMLGSVFAPILADAMATEDTFTNEGAFYVEADPSDTYTLEYSLTDAPGVLVINGENATVPFTGYSVLILDKSILRAEGADNTLQYRGDSQSIAGISKLDITISNGEVTGTYRLKWDSAETSDHSWPTTTYTTAYVASTTAQDLIMSNYNNPVKMNGVSEIFAFGQTAIGNTNVLVKISGSIDDNVTVSVLDRTTGEAITATITNLSINKTAVDSHIDLYELNSITFTATLEDESTANMTYSAYIVPAEVTAERAVHFDAAALAVLGSLMVVFIVAILLIAVRNFTSKD